MRDRLDTNRFATRGRQRRARQRGQLISVRAWVGIVTVLMGAAFAAAQDVSMGPPVEMEGWDAGGPPVTSMGEGSYFSQDLGTTLRARFNTRSYGQDDDQDGNLDIGTMQVVSFEDSIVFFDGQVTLSDVQGVGFNLGIGYRWLTCLPYATDAQRITGVSLWGDGTSTEANNFFPQLGVSFESLGDIWDLRANGYIPIGQDNQVGKFVPTGEIGFQSNFISELAIATVDQSFYAAEIELARRLGHERDAWGFVGPYELANDDQDTTGIRAGFRGYAYPDLLLQIAVSHDDIFATNTTFSLTWFIGRTRTNFHPACGVLDRFREPVMRNDYVVLAQSTALGGTPLTDTDGNAFRVVHVDSDAPAGGDGTFEHPLNNLDDINANSQSGDIVLAHAESTFNGQAAVLQDDQRFLGEGDGNEHTIVTQEAGTIPIPETFPGATNAARPMIVAAPGDAVTLGENNEVANFDFDGQNVTTSAIAGANLTENINLHDIDVLNGTGFGISLSTVDTTSTVTLNNYTYDGGTGPAGGIELDDFDGTFTATNSTLMNGTLAGVSITNDSDGTITFEDTVEFMSIDGTAFDVGGFTGALTVNSDITNDTGRSVSLQNVSASDAVATFTGDITDTGQGILVANSADGTILFSGDLTLTTQGNKAVQLLGNNDNADISFAGPLVISTTSGNGFEATNGGTLTVSNTNNTISTQSGQAVLITDMAISSPSGVNFSEINRTTAVATNAIQLENNTGGPIVLGTLGTAGDSGTLEGGAADVVRIENSANVTISSFVINNNAAFAGTRVVKSTNDAMTLNFNDLTINDGSTGVDVAAGGTTGNLIMTVNDTTVNNATQLGLNFDNVDAGTIAVNNGFVNGGGATAGVGIQNSSATFNLDSATRIQGAAGADFDVNGGTPNITMAGDITNTAGLSLQVQSVTGGSINFSSASSITDSGGGMRILNNSGGTFSFLGTNSFTTGNNDAIVLTSNTGATISIGQLDITTATADGFVATGGGTLSVVGNGNKITTVNGRGLDIEGMTIGSVDFESVNADGGDNGIRLVNNATGIITVGDAGNAVGQGGTIQNATDAGIHVENSNVTLNGVTVQNAGNAAGENAVEIFHSNAANVSANLNRLTVNNSTASRDGVVIDGTGNTGTFNANIQNVDVDVTGDGLVVNDGVTLTAGGTNTIDVVDGVGLRLNDVTISSSSANFTTVTVTSGDTNGIFMQDVAVTGAGQVQVGDVAGAANSGGMLTTTGDAIMLQNVANVDLRHLQVVSAGGQGVNIDHSGAAMDVTIDDLNLDVSTNEGIDVEASSANAFNLRLTASDLEERVDISNTGAGAFALLVDNTDVTTSGTDVAFTLSFSGSAVDGDVTIRNTSTFTAADNEALLITGDGSNPDIELAIDNSTFLNTSNTDRTVEIVNSNGARTDANVTNNSFTNFGTAEELRITSDGAASTRLNLNIVNNGPAGAALRLFTDNNGGGFNFGVVDRDNADTNNPGSVIFDPAIGDFESIMGPVESPTVP